MRKPTRAQLRRQFEAIAERYQPEMRNAFLAAVADIANRAELGQIIARLERWDIQGAIAAMHIDPAAYRALETSIQSAFGAGGNATVSGMPMLRDPSGGVVVLRFDMRAPRAEQYILEHSAQLVTRIVDDQRRAVSVALQQGLIDGRNPRSVALDIVGRVARGSNSRAGGVIGLTAQQAGAVDKARSALISGDVAGMRAYLNLGRRDKRFDSTVARAIRDGVPVSADMVARITGRYSDRLLALRGETIARTETLAALARSKEEAFRQAVDTGAVQSTQVKKRWIATKDNRTRDSHAAVDGEVVGFEGVFSNGLAYPHEEGAPAEETINCRCTYDLTIDFLAGIE